MPGLRKHKVNCEMFGTANEIDVPSEAYYESAENEESNEDEVQHHHEYVEALPQEIHMKAEPSPKRKKVQLARKSAHSQSRPTSHLHHQQQRIVKTESPPTNYEFMTPAATPRSLPKSRFADAARVWERKLEDLPFSQALQIEKSINDLLYEASLANAQDLHHPAPVIKVNIASQHLQQND